MIPFMTSSRCSMNCNAPREEQFLVALLQLPLTAAIIRRATISILSLGRYRLRCCCAAGQAVQAQAPFSHFFMKLVFAAPESGLPSWLTALVAQVASMHFFMTR